MTYQQEYHGNRSVHTQRLERWLGVETVAHILEQARGFPHPIAVAGVPGRVWVYSGDFVGVIEAGQFLNYTDYVVGKWRRALCRAATRNLTTLHAGFSSLSDLISEATVGGKKQVLPFYKQSSTDVATGASRMLWRRPSVPASGSDAAALPGGTIYTRTTTGAFGQFDATGGDTLHLIGGWMAASSAVGGALLLCDYLWGGQVNCNSATNQAVTGVPTRYQTATTAPGNFLGAQVVSTLGATPANLTVTYVDQDGNTAEAGSAQPLRVSSGAEESPTTAPEWRYRLNAGDTGLRKVTNFLLSAGMGAGLADWGIFHPLAIFPNINATGTPVFLDGMNTAFNFERIYDGACLTFWDWFKTQTTGARYSGYLVLCSG